MLGPTIAFDAMGGDFAPTEVVRAAARLSLESTLQVVLVGDEPILSGLLAQSRHNPERIAVHHASQAIGMGEIPAIALERKSDASIAVAAKLVADGVADALVTAGNTGAAVLACRQSMRLLPGVKRAALASVFPTERRRGGKSDPFSLILDVGAGLEATAEDLVTFAELGSAYARVISRNPMPRVALLSTGTEEEKGPDEVVEAHRLLRTLPGIDFVGNIEGLDIPRGVADVVVTNGFVGNVVIKMLEGVSETVLELARYAYKERLLWRMGITMLSGGIRQLKRVTDWQQYGGAPILGFDRVVIKAHGRSREQALVNAGKVAAKAVVANLTGAMGGQAAWPEDDVRMAAEG
ncbi:phosphate acyltransferase PlsX [Vulgatibacter incomptus]|uniref:Phosphate acyltransferase n=1 Tax=Vulgatibacter incomptus TaxID=1391653 RepID=A0A0K1P9K3_9BACT|nr:phosphate acyltransferase PlsX [Vulgatibacter incomptus]AKU90111.1 Phosphate:acyl-ACP acyltransferase PlsX [Vulgatibacter incomptus]